MHRILLSQRGRIFFNAAGFQLCWFACVVQPGPLSLTAVGAFIAVQAFWLSAAQRVKALLFALAGAGFDSLLLNTGWLNFPPATPFWLTADPLVPLWLMLLWLAFASTLYLSLRWLAGKPLLAAVAGALCAPFSYWAGSHMGAVSFTPTTLLLIALYWALALALMAGYRGSDEGSDESTAVRTR
ncbi:DUF2878 domain-containing protein [Thalassolituus sp. LLYu03]|uniref:DUF2878 domain-containing protein n=1 Tax=Thalassolituus sp. LLYu03 TaxID=3421656 RepID=UPI003D2E1C31